jgi:hypothetical protein
MHDAQRGQTVRTAARRSSLAALELAVKQLGRVDPLELSSCALNLPPPEAWNAACGRYSALRYCPFVQQFPVLRQG